MAATQGNGMFLVTQYIPAVNGQPLQQTTPSGQSAAWLQRFIKGEPKALGVVQIMIGITNICLGGVLASTWYVPIAVLTGVVFWASIFFLISGSLSIAAEKNGTRSLVKGALAMNIVSTVFALTSSIIYLIDLSRQYYYHTGCYSNGYDCYLNSYSEQAMRTGLAAVLFILSLLECGISISTFTFGCKSVCGKSSSEARQPVFVVQNAYANDPRFQPMQTGAGIPVAQGMPVMGQGMTRAAGAPMMQGMPASNIGPSVPAVATAPMPITETLYETVPGDALFQTV